MLLLATLCLSHLIPISGILRKENTIQDILFFDYNRYSTILSYLKSLRRHYSDKMQLGDIGKSFENRTILAVKISNNLKAKNRIAILIDGGMHAREWMSPAVALYIIYQLIQNKTNEYMFKDIDWYIIPLLNPDGYEYSHLYSKQWRKTRSKGDECYGVDINRNFDFDWSTNDSSWNECAPNYSGPKPFSESETRALRDIAFKFRANIKLYITIHAYANFLLYPWSSRKKPIKNELEYIHVGKEVAEAIKKVRGTEYEIGNIYKTLYHVSGSSCDWMAGVAKIPLCFGLELPSGKGKFFPNRSEILPTAIETFEGFKAFHKYLQRKYRT